MERSSPGLEEIFDKKLKAYASLDYKELKNPVDYYQNSIFVKQLEQRALCSRNRASPSLFLPRGRSASPTVLSNINLNNPNLVNPNCRRTKPDPWGLNPSSHCDFHNADLTSSFLSNNVGAFNSVAPNGVSNIASCCSRPATPCDSSISPKRVGSPFLRSKVLANRDKESLMDEIIDLKKALLDQSATLQRQRVLSTNLEQENRKLEKELEELVCQGSSTKVSSKPGPFSYDTRLRSKVQGLKTRVSQLEATCEIQQEELVLLRRDIRVTRTRDLQKSLEKATKEIHESSRRGNENMIRAKRAERQCQDLQEQSALLSKMVEKEKSEKLKLQQMIHVLQDDVQNLEASLSSKSKLQSSTNSDQNQHEEHQSGILAKTWGFLHGGPFHTTKTRELDAEECGKLLLGDRPKTRGEQRPKLAGGDPPEGRKSRPRSPTRSTDKRALETSKLPQTRGLMQNHMQGGEQHHSLSSKTQIQEGETLIAERSLHADKSAQASRGIEDHFSLSPSKQSPEDRKQKADLNNLDRLQHSRIAPNEEEEPHQTKDVITKLVEGMISIQESMHDDEKQSPGNLEELRHGNEEASSMLLHEDAQASIGSKMASNVLVPRLNLNQVGGHPHHAEENNSEESSNAVQTSTSNSNPSTVTALEQSHQKVIAWDDNIHNSGGQAQQTTAAHLDQKLAIIQESTAAVGGD